MKMNEAVATDIRKIIEGKIGSAECSSIILFGSRARGDFKENSDFDILLRMCRFL